MARDTDKRASSFETENTGGLLSGFLAEEDVFDRRTLWRLGFWGVASVGAVVLAVYANQSSTHRTPGPARGGAAGRANPARGQGKPGRGPAAGFRHRDPQRRSRPAVFPRHRAGTGPGNHDRRDCEASRAVAVARAATVRVNGARRPGERPAAAGSEATAGSEPAAPRSRGVPGGDDGAEARGKTGG